MPTLHVASRSLVHETRQEPLLVRRVVEDNSVRRLRQSDDLPQLRPYLLIPSSDADTGQRLLQPTNDKGPDSPSIWIERFEGNGNPGPLVSTVLSGQEYQIAVQVRNLGNAPTFALCVDFLIWHSIAVENGVDVHLYTFLTHAPDMVLMEGETAVVRSKKWIAGAINEFLAPGDIIVRAFDPVADHYSDNGRLLLVQNDRHLAHRGF